MKRKLQTLIIDRIAIELFYLIYFMKLNIYNDSILVGFVPIEDGDIVFDNSTYNSIINNILRSTIYNYIICEFDEPLYYIRGLHDYCLYSESGKDIKPFLPTRMTVYNCPKDIDVPDTELYKLYKVKGFRYTSQNISYSCLVKQKTKPNKRTATEYNCRLIDHTTVSVVKKTYDVYYNKLKELSLTTIYRRNISKRELDLLEKISPVMTELNKMENLVMPGYEILNPVQLDFTKDKINGKLFRNHYSKTNSYSIDYWEEQTRILIKDLDHLPMIYNKSLVMNYDTPNPDSPEHGSIWRGYSYGEDLDIFKDSLKISLDEISSQIF